MHAALISVCAALQFSIFLLLPSEVSRFHPLDLRTLATIIWTKNIMLPLFGGPGIRPFHSAYLQWSGLWGQILGIGLLFAELGVLYALVRRIRSRDRILILGSFVLTSVFSIAFAIGDKAQLISEYSSTRYFYAPNFMLFLLLLLNVDRKGASTSKRSFTVWVGLLIVVLLTAASRFRHFGGSWDISWKREVAAWREDPRHGLRIWPEGWAISLDPEARDIRK